MKVILYLLFLTNLTFAQETNSNHTTIDMNSQKHDSIPAIEESNLDNFSIGDLSNSGNSEIVYWTF